MSRISAAGARTPAKKNGFRPVLVRAQAVTQSLTPEVEIRQLKGELARVRLELRELQQATHWLVRDLM